MKIKISPVCIHMPFEHGAEKSNIYKIGKLELFL